jgi:maltooligosyltrehalose trehalohydrolase
VVSDPQNPETFAESKLQWDERFLEPHRSLLELYRTLIEARRRHPALTDPAFPTSVRHGAGWFVIDRAGLASVVINLSDLDLFVTAAGRIVVATDPGITADHGQVWMPAESAAVLLYP